MGYIKHEAVIVTTSDFRPGALPDMDAFRASLPENLRHLVIGPVESAINNYYSYVFLPDGSKEGWPNSDAGDEARKRFKELFRHQYSDGSSLDNMAHVVLGDEHNTTNRVVDQNPTPGRLAAEFG